MCLHAGMWRIAIAKHQRVYEMISFPTVLYYPLYSTIRTSTQDRSLTMTLQTSGPHHLLSGQARYTHLLHADLADANIHTACVTVVFTLI